MGYISNVLVEIIQNDVVIKYGYTDGNGKYTTKLDAGVYKIRLSKTGFKTTEKIETLDCSTELMVNLPIEYYFTAGISHLGVQLFKSGQTMNNPTIQTISNIYVNSNTKTCQILTLHEESVA